MQNYFDSIVNYIKYKDYTFHCIQHTESDLLEIVILRLDVDSVSGEYGPRMYNALIPITAYESNVVHKIFGLLLGLAQHEVCEFFELDGVKIFNPHSNVWSLVEALG